jgi:hypothetical protein
VLRMSNKRLQRVYSFWFATIGFVALVPSTYFLYGLYKDELVKQKIGAVVIEPIRRQGNEILKWELQGNDSSTLVKIYHSGNALKDSFKQVMNASLAAEGLGNFKVLPMRVNLTREEITHLSADVTRQVFAEMQARERPAAAPQNDTTSFRQLQQEIEILFPGVALTGSGWMQLRPPSSKDSVSLFSYTARRPLKNDEEMKLQGFLQARTRSDSVMTVFIPRR